MAAIPKGIKNWYEVLILSKFKCNAYIQPFPSRMGRKLLYITFINNSTDIVKVGSVHLESLNNCNKRENQMKISYEILDGIEKENIGFDNKYKFLVGDFNFSDRETPLIYSFGYTDVGAEVVKKDSTKNSNLKWSTMKAMKGYPAWRPDRITYKTSSKSFGMKHFEIVGSEPIKILDKL
eukprot:CAMPEP_0170537984 /NCGR_PEP_ID=MMETSP0209-20121228/103041_1 /TAXON_ID=665100 ORGANISM="Litonotus pictus, Strain P1" /NCGR_SAMPLE_ID=MMETSP0209 /ASSEMBLY_ACC=CAM_ASM_000301 /LENGTH=178 /DNA_ID=CAMNT_0010839587 /DNA_START=509 /DNA_END=1041 /DNA_ORIENTATION=-